MLTIKEKIYHIEKLIALETDNGNLEKVSLYNLILEDLQSIDSTE